MQHLISVRNLLMFQVVLIHVVNVMMVFILFKVIVVLTFILGMVMINVSKLIYQQVININVFLLLIVKFLMKILLVILLVGVLLLLITHVIYAKMDIIYHKNQTMYILIEGLNKQLIDVVLLIWELKHLLMEDVKKYMVILKQTKIWLLFLLQLLIVLKLIIYKYLV